MDHDETEVRTGMAICVAIIAGLIFMAGAACGSVLTVILWGLW